MKETFSEWLDKNWTDKDNMCPPPLPAQKAVYFLLDYLIGDWYSAMPMSTEHINVEIVNLILSKYSKKYRKERKKHEH